nr:hypothetical protein [Liquorilactobacillus satsumensis]
MKTLTKTHSWLFKLSLLSISILAMTAPSIAVANPLLEKTFAQESTAKIEMIATLQFRCALDDYVFNGDC